MTDAQTNLADELLALFAQAGFSRADAAILQPTSVFVDLSGEDIRRRLFVTTDADGHELCLRPEFTIPVAREYLAHHAGQSARLDASYAGPVFRHRPGETGEFVQAGVESFGRSDREAADAQMLALAQSAVALAGLEDADIRFGDAGLFADLLSALAIGNGAARRLKRAYAAGRLAEALKETGQPAANAPGYTGLLAAIEGQDPKAARVFVEDVLKIAGIERVGGRTAGEIAERFLRQAGERHDTELSADARQTLSRFLAITGDPDQAAGALRKLATETGLDIGPAIDRFEARTGFLAAQGIDLSQVLFSTALARNLDYYTGFVFEIRDPRRADGKLVVGGGRYDGLLGALGGSEPIPAVGFSMWLDRLSQRNPA